MDRTDLHKQTLLLFVALVGVCVVNVNGAPLLSMTEIEKLISCTFEVDLCNWEQGNTTDQFDWTRYQQMTPTSDTGPDFDHNIGDSTGYYIYIETSAPRKVGETAVLKSPVISTWNSNYMCVSMWYHAKGAALGGLTLQLEQTQYINQTKTLWTFPGNSDTAWREFKTSIIPTGPFKLIIEAQVGKGYQGDIAVDDISVTSGVCPMDSTTDSSAGQIFVG